MGSLVELHTQSAKHDKMSPPSKVAPGHHVDEKSPKSILARAFRFWADSERLGLRKSRIRSHMRDDRA